jgi:hypothetical protein
MTTFTLEIVRENLSTSAGWVERALVVLLSRQTSDEQVTKTTSHKNGRGFGAFDAELLSSFGEQVQAGRHLSQKQLAIAFKRVPRYARQILEEIEERG